MAKRRRARNSNNKKKDPGVVGVTSNPLANSAFEGDDSMDDREQDNGVSLFAGAGEDGKLALRSGRSEEEGDNGMADHVLSSTSTWAQVVSGTDRSSEEFSSSAVTSDGANSADSSCSTLISNSPDSAESLDPSSSTHLHNSAKSAELSSSSSERDSASCTKELEKEVEALKRAHATDIQKIAEMLRLPASSLELGDYEAWLNAAPGAETSTRSNAESNGPVQLQPPEAEPADMGTIVGLIRDLQMHKRFSRWIYSEIVEDAPVAQTQQHLQGSQRASNNKKKIDVSKVQLMKTRNAHDNELKGLKATISGLQNTNKSLEQQLKERKNEIKSFKAKELIVHVGAAVINRYFELSKVPMFGVTRNDLNKSIIARGNMAAHGGNLLVHKAFLDAGLCRVRDGLEVFRKLYRLPHGDANATWPPIMLRAVNLNATFITINDGEGAWDLREKARGHVNTLLKLWNDRKDDHTFASSTHARVELTLLEKVVDEIVHTRHDYEWVLGE